MTATEYPFVPKSTVRLAPGQFWSIPLDGGSFACGRVLQVDESQRCHFIAGLLDWSDTTPPTADSIVGTRVLAHGMVHVKTVAENGGEVLGMRALELDDLDVPLSLDESPSSKCRLRRGFEVLGVASEEQQRQLGVFQTWGFRAIKIRAEQHFGAGAADRAIEKAARDHEGGVPEPTGLVFRETSAADVESMFSVRALTRDNPISKEGLAAYGITPTSTVADLESGKMKGWGCFHDSVLVGFCNGDGTTGEVLVLAVLPNCEGRGIGSRLLSHVVGWLRSKGHPRPWLAADSDPRVRAHGFYRALGWKPTGRALDNGDEILELEPSPRSSTRL